MAKGVTRYVFNSQHDLCPTNGFSPVMAGRAPKDEQAEQSERLRQAREAAGFKSSADACRRFDWNTSTYNAHENGQNGIRLEPARTYAKAFDVDAGWILAGTGRGPGQTKITRRERVPTSHLVDIGKENYTAIGRFDATFSMGPGSLIADNPEPLGFYLMETQWLRTISRAAPEHLAAVRVGGDSMERTLCDGDWVLIDKTQTRVTREGVYAIRVGDDTWVKRLSLNLRKKLVRVISDNQLYGTDELPEEDLAIIGRVISLIARKVP